MGGPMHKISMALSALALAGAIGCGASSDSRTSSESELSSSDDFTFPKNPLAQPVTVDFASPDTPTCTLSNGASIKCNIPRSIRHAYDVPSTLDGSGQTIVIVDAYGSPTVLRDLQLFDAIFGLP